MLERSNKLRTRQVFSNFTDQIITKFQSMSGFTPMLKRELLKFECQKFSIRFGKQQSKDQSKTYADNVRELNDILNIPGDQ